MSQWRIMTSCNVSLMSLLSCNGVNFPYKGDENHLFTNLVTNTLCVYCVNPIFRWHNWAQRQKRRSWSSVLSLNLALLCSLMCTLKLEVSISPQIFEKWIATFLGVIPQIDVWNIPKMCMTINTRMINLTLWHTARAKRGWDVFILMSKEQGNLPSATRAKQHVGE